MASINDYLLWRGDLAISYSHPFNDVDSMILARFSYLPFYKINMKKKETIASIYKKMQYFEDKDFMYPGDKELIYNLAQSNRFKKLSVTDYVIDNNRKNEKQFSAITIHLSKHELYLSYFGTDYTIYAWKEDFNMGFMENVPCQIEGKNYLENIAKKYRTKKFRLGGHSKGGNIAIYATIATLPRIQHRIIKVYNFDGPGFNKAILEKYGKSDVLAKIETYIPQESIVGRILNHKEKTTIVLSNEKGLLQHDIHSWQVLKDKPIKVKKNTKSSETIDRTLTKWLENTTEEQRKVFINTIFELLYSTGSKTFGDFTNNLYNGIPKMLKKYSSVSKEDRKEITEMIKLLITYYLAEDRKERKIQKKTA